MKILRAAAVIVVATLGPAWGASTINPTLPASGLPYSSIPIRNNFGAAANDIQALQSMNAGATAPSAPTLGMLWLNTPVSATLYPLSLWDGSHWALMGSLDTVNHLWIPTPGGFAPIADNATLATTPISYSHSIIRLDYSGGFGAPPLIFVGELGTCAANSLINDGGNCVNSSDGNSWVAAPRDIYDIREWGRAGVGTPVLFVNGTTGVDANNFCYAAATPCATWPYAVNIAQSTWAFNHGVQIDVAAGTYAGGTIGGQPPGSGANQKNYIYTLGAGVGVTTFTSPSIIFEVDHGAAADFGNLTVNIPTGGYGFWAANAGILVFNSGTTTEIIGNNSVTNGTHTESGGTIEIPQTAAISIKGTFAQVFSVDNHSNLLGDGNTVTCEGTVATTQFLYVVQGSNAHFIDNHYTNCSGLTGDLLLMDGSSSFRNDGDQLPGNGAFNIQEGSTMYPPYRPTLGTCLNGALSPTSDNNVMAVIISGGSNSSCTINMGVPASPASGYYKNAPVCTVSIDGAAGNATSYSYISSNDIIALHPTTALTGGAYEVHCNSQF